MPRLCVACGNTSTARAKQWRFVEGELHCNKCAIRKRTRTEAEVAELDALMGDPQRPLFFGAFGQTGADGAEGEPSSSTPADSFCNE